MEKVKCESCGYKFKMTKDRIKRRIVRSGIKEDYFDCPKCKTKYPFARTNEKIREMMKEANEIRQNIKNRNFAKVDNLDELWAKLADLKEQIETEMNKLFDGGKK